MSKINTGIRHTVAAIKSNDTLPNNTIISYGFVSNMEIDNHADTHCFGKNFVPIYFTGKVCDVSPFADSYTAMTGVPICTACTAYDDPTTGLTIILEFPHGLWLADHMDHSLISPNQCRIFGISLCDDPFDPHRDLSIYDPHTDIYIPLSMSATTVMLTTRAPTQDEIQHCTRTIIMCDDTEWDPHNVNINVNQKHNVDLTRTISAVASSRTRQCIDDELMLSSISPALTDFTMLPALISQVHVANVSSITSDTRHSSISPDNLASKWKVSLETARNTLHATTQHAVRSAQHPLRRRYRTDLLLARYRRLNAVFYSDTMFSKYKSLRGYKTAQIFANEHMVQLYPMTSKSHAGEALQNFIDDVGVPNKIVVDGAQEQVGSNSEFAKTCRKVKSKLGQTEPYTPRQNRCEYYIGELKRRWRTSMLTRNIPKRLWDFGMMYHAEIMSRTARGENKRTGLECVTGETPDISEWLDFSLYDLVWFWNKPFSK